MKPHKHAELIKAWADGAEIESFGGTFNKSGQIEECWVDDPNPLWHEHIKYRIKFEPKPDYFTHIVHIDGTEWQEDKNLDNYSIGTNPIKLTFDGETGELKSAEVLK